MQSAECRMRNEKRRGGEKDGKRPVSRILPNSQAGVKLA